MRSFLFDESCVLKVQIDFASIRFRKDSSSNNANIEEKTNRQWLNVTISSQQNYDERKFYSKRVSKKNESRENHVIEKQASQVIGTNIIKHCFTCIFVFWQMRTIKLR
jgi:hypothetical protein